MDGGDAERPARALPPLAPDARRVVMLAEGALTGAMCVYRERGVERESTHHVPHGPCVPPSAAGAGRAFFYGD